MLPVMLLQPSIRSILSIRIFSIMAAKFDFKGKVIAITGGASGIGLAKPNSWVQQELNYLLQM